jgi:hypothetical protein
MYELDVVSCADEDESASFIRAIIRKTTLGTNDVAQQIEKCPILLIWTDADRIH